MRHGVLPAHPARRRSPPRTSTGPPARSRCSTEAAALARDRPPPPRRRLLLRHQRHQRPRHPRGGARSPRPCHDGRGGSRPPAIPWAALGQTPRGPAPRQAARLPCPCQGQDPDSRSTSPTPCSRARAALRTTRAVVVGADRDRAAGRPRRPRRRARRTRPWSRARAASRGQGRLRLPRPGLPVGRHGPRAARHSAGLRARGSPSARRRSRPASRLVAARRACGRRRAAWLDRVDVVQPALFASWSPWPSCGAPSASSPTPSSATPRARSPPPSSPGRCPRGRRRLVGAAQPRLIPPLAGRAPWSPLRSRGRASAERLEPYGGAALDRRASTAPLAVVSGDPEALRRAARRLLRRTAQGPPHPGRLRLPLRPGRRDPRGRARDAPRRRSQPRPAEIPFYSTVTGEPLDTTELDAEYWYRNLRRAGPVRAGDPQPCSQTAQHLRRGQPPPRPDDGRSGDGRRRAHGPRLVAVLGTLRRDEGGLAALPHLPGRPPTRTARRSTGHALFKGTGATTVELPTYPFQRQRYWLDLAAPARRRLPLGSAAPTTRCSAPRSRLAAEGSHLLTGRLSLATHPWLADHAVAGTCPARHRLRRARAARRDEVGAAHLEELTLQAPLLIPESGRGPAAAQPRPRRSERGAALRSRSTRAPRQESSDDDETLDPPRQRRPHLRQPPATRLRRDAPGPRPAPSRRRRGLLRLRWPRPVSTTAPPSRASRPPGAAARNLRRGRPAPEQAPKPALRHPPGAARRRPAHRVLHSTGAIRPTAAAAVLLRGRVAARAHRRLRTAGAASSSRGGGSLLAGHRPEGARWSPIGVPRCAARSTRPQLRPGRQGARLALQPRLGTSLSSARPGRGSTEPPSATADARLLDACTAQMRSRRAGARATPLCARRPAKPTDPPRSRPRP